MFKDNALVAKIKEGDVKAFEEFFRLYYVPLCNYALAITGEINSAEEVVAELFYKFWKKREELQITQSLKSYLFTAVRYEAIHFCESRMIREQYKNRMLDNAHSFTNLNPHEELEGKELHGLIN